MHTQLSYFLLQGLTYLWFSWNFVWQDYVSARSSAVLFCLHCIVWKLTPFLSAEWFDDLQYVSARSAVPFCHFLLVENWFLSFGWISRRLTDRKCPLSCHIFYCKDWLSFFAWILAYQLKVSARSAVAFSFARIDFHCFSWFWMAGLGKCPLSVPLCSHFIIFVNCLVSFRLITWTIDRE